MRRRFDDQCTNIVTWHRIGAGCETLDFLGAPRHSPSEFERQIDYLSSNYNIVSLGALVEALEHGEPPTRTAVLTFDDGYADTLNRAMPILYRRRLPMTVFLVTSAVGNRDLMWQHKLGWLLANGQGRLVEQAFESHGLAGRNPGEPLGQFARRCFRADVPLILESVLELLGKGGASLAGELRPYLEAEEIARTDAEFVTFENHTHTHPVLSALDEEEQRSEFATARNTILSLTGFAPIAAAYPFGLRRHYTRQTKRIVQETWHRAALNMQRRVNEGLVDPFELSRKPAAAGSQRLFEQMIEDLPAEEANAERGGDERISLGGGSSAVR